MTLLNTRLVSIQAVSTRYFSSHGNVILRSDSRKQDTLFHLVRKEKHPRLNFGCFEATTVTYTPLQIRHASSRRSVRASLQSMEDMQDFPAIGSPKADMGSSNGKSKKARKRRKSRVPKALEDTASMDDQSALNRELGKVNHGTDSRDEIDLLKLLAGRTKLAKKKDTSSIPHPLRLMPAAKTETRCRRLTPAEKAEALRRRLQKRAMRTNCTTLPPPTEEQQLAMQLFKEKGCNLIVEACAGSGKTTLILHLAEDNPELEFLIISYNTRLAAETRQRAKAVGLGNTTISTIHALGVKYYTSECCTDIGLKRVVEEETELKQMTEFDVMVLDELQDMTPIMKRFLDKFWRDVSAVNGCNKQCRIAALGDPRQEIYVYNDSDARFLTQADSKDVFGYMSIRSWERVNLSRSNRLTPTMVDFINTDIGDPGGKLIFSNRPDTSRKPRYIVCATFADAEGIIRDIMDEENLAEEDVLILAPSTRNSGAAKHVANRLAQAGYAIHVPVSETTESINPRATEGKIVCCTFHQAKGLERTAVFILGFDSSYHEFYERNPVSLQHAGNALFVAVTRAKEHLVLLHDHCKDFLPHIQKESLEQRVDYVQKRKFKIPDEPALSAKDVAMEQLLQYRASTPSGVTDLLRHIPDSVTASCLQHIALEELSPPGYPTKVTTIINDSLGLSEEVYEITGISVPSFHEILYRSQFTILKAIIWEVRLGSEIRQTLNHEHISKFMRLKKKWEKTHALEPNEVLYLCTLHSAFLSGYANKLHSIPKTGYGWVSKEQAQDMACTLDEWIPENADVMYEQYQETTFKDVKLPSAKKETPCVLQGALDVVIGAKGANPTLIEVKYTSNLDPSHLLQTFIYKAMMEEITAKRWNAILLNVRTGQAVKVSGKEADSYRQVIQMLVDYKYKISPNCEVSDVKDPSRLIKDLTLKSDDDFLKEAKVGFSSRVGSTVLPRWFTANPAASKEEIRQLRKNGLL